MKMINKILYMIFGVGTVFLLLGCMFYRGEKRDIFVENFRPSEGTKETKIVTKEFDMEDKKIGLEITNSEVVIREGNGDHIKIEYDKNLYEEPLIVDNNQIEIKTKKSYFGNQKLVGFVFLSYWGESSRSVEVTLPKEMYQEITGNIVRAEVEIKSLNMNKMNWNIRDSHISIRDCEIKNEVECEGNDSSIEIDDGTFGKLLVHSNNSVGEFRKINSKNVKINAKDSSINLWYHKSIDAKNLRFDSEYMEGDYEVKNGQYYVKKNENGVLLELEIDKDSSVEIK